MPSTPRAARGLSSSLSRLKRSPRTLSYVEGELIAVDDDAFHVLTAAGLRSVSCSSPYRITIVGDLARRRAVLPSGPAQAERPH